jgi:squalene synthase HpnD
MSLEPVADHPVARLPTAQGSSFYAAMRILPARQREAMFAIYGFCRAVDDIADQGGERAERLAALAGWREAIAALYAHGDRAGRLLPLLDPIRRFGLRRADFEAIIDGMVMDAEADIRAPDWATLDLYCDRVASAVGRLAVRVFGVPDAHGPQLAHHLGRALQLTNILRDIDEDAQSGRLYLPREALSAAGITPTSPLGAVAHPNFAAACAPLVERARGHFASAAKIIDACPRAATRSPRLMASVYGGLLDGLVAQGFAPPRTRVRIAKLRLIWTVLRHGFF